MNLIYNFVDRKCIETAEIERRNSPEVKAADDSPEELGTLFGAACERSRAAAARHDSLDARSVRPGSNGEPFSLRWIFVHMIEDEEARGE